jgi:hypothetical protein
MSQHVDIVVNIGKQYTIVVDVRNCARCGLNHSAVTFHRMARPVVDLDGTEWVYYAPCPTTGDPILLKNTKIADRPRVSILFAWFDFWVGLYYDRHNRVLYVNPLPCIVVRIERVDKIFRRA